MKSGHRAHLPDLAVGVDEHHARRIGETAAMRVDFFERSQARGTSPARSCSRVRDLARAPFVLDARALASSDSRAASRHAARHRRPSCARCKASAAVCAAPRAPLELDAELARFEIEARLIQRRRARAARAAESCAAVERGDGVEHRVDVGARLLDVLLERLDRHPRARVFFRRGRSQRRRFVARAPRLPPPPVRRPSSATRSGSRRASSCMTLLIELARRASSASRPCCVSSAICCWRRLISSSCACTASRAPRSPRHPRDASSMRMRPSSFSTSARRAEAAASFVRASFSRARAASIASDSAAIAAGEQHFLPAPHLIAQARVAARLRRLALQRSALLVDLVNDVFEARQVLLRRFELQLRGAPAAPCSFVMPAASSISWRRSVGRNSARSGRVGKCGIRNGGIPIPS